MEIRPETPVDYPAVHTVNALAFGRENEAGLVEAVRRSPSYIPELSLVAVLDGQVVGHILFSWVGLETPDGSTQILALAPVAVLPGYQNQGIGSALVRQGLVACREAGYWAVVVLGHSGYYPRFGFSPARPRGIEAPFPVADKSWMVAELVPGALDSLRGTVRYPPAFDEV